MYIVTKCWEKFKFLEDLLYWGDLIFFLREGARPFSSIKQSMTNHVKHSWWQHYLFHVCMLTFLTFTWEFSVWEFSVCSSVHSNYQKSVYYCLVKTLWKCEYCLISALNKSILFVSNSLKMSVLCDMNSEKKFLL